VSGIDKILIAMAWSTSSNVFNVSTDAMEASLRGRTSHHNPVASSDIGIEDDTSQCEFSLRYHSLLQNIKSILGYTACNLIQRREPVYHR
jgi:hypothetical protein